MVNQTAPLGDVRARKQQDAKDMMLNIKKNSIGSAFIVLSIAVLGLISACSQSPCEKPRVQSDEDLKKSIESMKLSAINSAFVKRTSSNTYEFLVELERDATIESFAKKLPKEFDQGWADYAGGANDILFHGNGLTVTIKSEQECPKHTLVEISRTSQ